MQLAIPTILELCERRDNGVHLSLFSQVFTWKLCKILKFFSVVFWSHFEKVPFYWSNKQGLLIKTRETVQNSHTGNAAVSILSVCIMEQLESLEIIMWIHIGLNISIVSWLRKRCLFISRFFFKKFFTPTYIFKYLISFCCCLLVVENIHIYVLKVNKF